MNKDINILIVDDYKVAAQSISIMLKRNGFTKLDETNDGPSALEKMKTTQYDLILADHDMEPMTGLQLIKAIRESGNKVPFIMITGNSTPENEAAARAAGVNDFIGKYPYFNPDMLKEKIKNIFGS